jgi:hypothetical protein
MFRQISLRNRLTRNSSDLLHAANLRHGTDGFTSPPKEGVLRIFSPLKIRRLWLGLNPRTCILKAITLLLDHQSCCFNTYTYEKLPGCSVEILNAYIQKTKRQHRLPLAIRYTYFSWIPAVMTFSWISTTLKRSCIKLPHFSWFL